MLVTGPFVSYRDVGRGMRYIKMTAKVETGAARKEVIEVSFKTLA
jgi:hypothetical protein